MVVEKAFRDIVRIGWESFSLAREFVTSGSFSHEEYKIVTILRLDINTDFKKCKTVWEGFEQSASWFNKMPELKEGTKVWDRHVQRPQEYYGGIIDTGAEIWAEDAQPILSSRHL
ncbi:hypothetical protein MtrunA17_Chr8g0340551 [Medicago truncatula]|uniref:Uncharacterized protein n=1 Tax=Medicago truncatula TaxID=3880 RepID=A0A396GC45_MEDTR|nr:hypothetical protein MtrunA17_Chr8g0340551 [Medicago truncatula]